MRNANDMERRAALIYGVAAARRIGRQEVATSG
jgi:hypothetical protein